MKSSTSLRLWKRCAKAKAARWIRKIEFVAKATMSIPKLNLSEFLSQIAIG
jgi:hypothetical protein